MRKYACRIDPYPTFADCMKSWPEGYPRPTQEQFEAVESRFHADRGRGEMSMREVMLKYSGESVGAMHWIATFAVFMPELKNWWRWLMYVSESNSRSWYEAERVNPFPTPADFAIGGRAHHVDVTIPGVTWDRIEGTV